MSLPPAARPILLASVAILLAVTSRGSENLEAAIEAAIEAAEARGSKKFPLEAGIFIDYASLCQKDAHGQRTPDEAAAFSAALSTMQLWYAHTLLTAFLTRVLPHKARLSTCQAIMIAGGRRASPVGPRSPKSAVLASGLPSLTLARPTHTRGRSGAGAESLVQVDTDEQDERHGDAAQ